jgi:hypothetical protein
LFAAVVAPSRVVATISSRKESTTAATTQSADPVAPTR